MYSIDTFLCILLIYYYKYIIMKLSFLWQMKKSVYLLSCATND